MSDSSRSRSRWQARLRWGLATLVVVGAAAALFVKHAADRLAEPPTLRTVDIERRDLRIVIATSGTVEPAEVIEVGSLVSGRIVGFGNTAGQQVTSPIEVGTRVGAGTLLVQLDQQLYEVELRKARAAAQLAEAEVKRFDTQLRQATRKLERGKRLRSTNPEAEFDEILTAHEMAQAQLGIALAQREQAVADVDKARINLANTTIRSPIDGVVIDRRANLGQNVSAGSGGLFLLARDLKTMQVRASVSETDIGKIRVGQPASFQVDAHRDNVLVGRVEKILLNARMQGNFVTYDVLVAIDGSTESLLPHMTADVEFEVVKREDAWLVPSDSLQWWPSQELITDSTFDGGPVEGGNNLPQPQEGDDAVVWLPASDGLVRPMQVRVGLDDGVVTEVIGDLDDGMRIVVGVVERTTLARIIPSVKTVR